MARFANPYSPRTDIGAGMQNIMTAMFANKANAGAAGAGHRSPAQDVKDRADALKAEAEANQINRVEQGIGDFTNNFTKSLVPENEVPLVSERSKTGTWPAFEDPRRQQSVTEGVGPVDWSSEKDAQLTDAKRNQAYLLATKEANFKDLAGSMEGAASDRDLMRTLGQFLPSGKGSASAGPATPQIGLPSGPGMAKATPTQATDEYGAVTKPYAEVGPIDMNRKKIDNADGSFSTERTITVEADGKQYLIPTIVDGQQLTPEQATQAWQEGRNKEVGVYGSPAEAEQAAVARSQQIGNVRGPAAAAPEGSIENPLKAPEVGVNGKDAIDTNALLNAAAAVAGKHHEVSTALTGVANAARGQQEADFKEREKNAWKPLPGVEAAFYNDKGMVIDANGSRQLTGDEARALGIAQKKAGAMKLDVDVNSFDKTGGAERAKAVQNNQNNAMEAIHYANTARAAAQILEGYGGGWTAELQAKIGRILPESEYGKVASVDDVARGLRAKMSPLLRAVGSGATSDLEFGEFMSAFPSLSQTPAGRQFIDTVFNRIAERLAGASDIYGDLAEQGRVRLTDWSNAVTAKYGKTLLTPEETAQIRGGVVGQTRQQKEDEVRRLRGQQ